MAKGYPIMGRGTDGKAKIANITEDGNLITQQNGNGTEVKIFPRAIYTENSSITVPIAPGIKSIDIFMQVHGVTGDFSGGGGFRLGAQLQYNDDRFIQIPTIAYSTNTGTVLMSFGKKYNLEKDGAVGQDSEGFYSCESVGGNNIRVFTGYLGTFDSGEGIDAEVSVILNY